MSELKLFTPQMGGRWTRYNYVMTKEKFESLLAKGIGFLIADPDGKPSTWGALMFSDGTIYDKDKGYRDESIFPKDETIEYMNKILNGEI